MTINNNIERDIEVLRKHLSSKGFLISYTPVGNKSYPSFKLVKEGAILPYFHFAVHNFKTWRLTKHTGFTALWSGGIGTISNDVANDILTACTRCYSDKITG